MDAMRCTSVTALDFARGYASRSGMTLRQFALARPDREVRECDCDFEECEGWQMSSPELRRPWESDGVPIVDLALADAAS